MLRLDWWLLAFWVVVLAGLVGGKVYQQHARWQRRCYLVVLAYLLALLAIAILPEIAPRREIDAEIRAYAEYALPLAFVLIALFPAEPESAEAAHIIDFFYSVFLMLVLGVVILGSFTFMTRDGARRTSRRSPTPCSSPPARMLLVGLAWNPRSGGGLERVFLPLPVLDRPAGGEVAARSRRAARRWRRGRSASSARRWRRCCACLRSRACAGAPGRPRGEQGEPHRRMRSTTPRASSRSPSSRAIASARRCTGTCTCSASCWASSTSPSCARRSCARRATCRRCTRPARA